MPFHQPSTHAIPTMPGHPWVLSGPKEYHQTKLPQPHISPPHQSRSAEEEANELRQTSFAPLRLCAFARGLFIYPFKIQNPKFSSIHPSFPSYQRLNSLLFLSSYVFCLPVLCLDLRSPRLPASWRCSCHGCSHRYDLSVGQATAPCPIRHFPRRLVA